MATMNDWVKEAEEQAKRYSDTLKQNNQYLIDQLAQSKQNALNQLQEQQNNTLYNLNTNKSAINSTAEENARQLDVARMLALKSNQQSLNRAGLGTQGIVGSQVNAINNNYNSNLSSVLNEKANALRELEKSKNDALLQYNTNRLNTESEYGSNLANLQSAINDKALNQYNTVYSNYLNQKQQEYENQQAEIARQEAIRQYNENLSLQKAQLEYQKEQDKIANAQRWAQINAQKEANKALEFDDNEENNSYDRSNLYSQYNWSSNAVKEIFRWANGGYGSVNESSRNQILNSVKTMRTNKEMTEEEANIILDALGI